MKGTYTSYHNMTIEVFIWYTRYQCTEVLLYALYHITSTLQEQQSYTLEVLSFR